MGREPMISTTSAHVCVWRRDQIKMTKGAGPAGGERSKVEGQTRPVPHKRVRWNAKRGVCLGSESSAVGVESAKVRVQWRAVRVVGAQRSLERSQACNAVQNCGSVEAAGEKSPASDITVRGDRASGRSERR